MPPTSASSATASSVLAAKPAQTKNANKAASITKPLWAELKPEQQTALTPLQPEWLKMSEAQKRKWLEVSKNYGKLSPDDKTKLQARMSEWAKLSPEQRAQARINFSQAKKLSTDEKQKQWQAYQALSPDEKKKLQSKAKTNTPNSAALAAKPQNKVVPLTKKTPEPANAPVTTLAPAVK
jgi:hypothetical protein